MYLIIKLFIYFDNLSKNDYAANFFNLPNITQIVNQPLFHFLKFRFRLII